MNIVTVISNEIVTRFRKIKVRRLGQNDIQTPTQAAPFGVDSAPIKNMRAIYADTDKKGKPVIIGYINRELIAGDGETRIFSLDENGELATFIWLKADGTMQIGGDADNAVRFSELKTGFDQLKSDHDALVDAFNSHMHATAGTGPPVPPTPGTGIPAMHTTASIDDSKIDEIKTL
jgi:hypothetical protein